MQSSQTALCNIRSQKESSQLPKVKRLEAPKRVRVLDDLATLDDRRNNGNTSVSSCSHIFSQGVSLGIEILVDNTGHASLAVVAVGLGAVVPDGIVVGNDDLEDVGGLAAGGGLEAGEEGGGV